MNKYLMTLFALVFLAVGNAVAQDDYQPPISSNPDRAKVDELNNFKGFKKQKKIDWNKFIIEPNFNFAIGQDFIYLGLSPYFGYNVWKGLYVGTGFTYIYSQNSDYRIAMPPYRIKISDQVGGAGVFLQYNIWRGIFARTKFEVLNRRIPVSVSIPDPNNPNRYIVDYERKTIPVLLIGGGYNLLRSKNFFFPIAFYYNVLHNTKNKDYSIYPRPFLVQLGFINVF